MKRLCFNFFKCLYVLEEKTVNKVTSESKKPVFFDSDVTSLKPEWTIFVLIFGHDDFVLKHLNLTVFHENIFFICWFWVP